MKLQKTVLLYNDQVCLRTRLSRFLKTIETITK